MYQVGDKVQVEYYNTWYDGVVVEVRGGLVGVRVNETVNNGGVFEWLWVDCGHLLKRY